MDLKIRTIAPQEYQAWGEVLDTAFGAHLTPAELEQERAVAEIDRCLAAFDGDRMVGAAAAASLTMTLPGGEIGVAGVTGVGVLPTHRRRGINSALMRRQLDDLHAGGEPVAALYASEGPIYGRYGYGVASFTCSIDVERERSAFVRGYQPSGSIHLLDREEALKRLQPVHDRARRQRPGMMGLDPTWFAYRFGETHHGEERKYFFVAHGSEDDAFDGYAVYHVKHEWHRERRNELAVEDVEALTPQAYADLWRYLFDVDLMDRITAWNRPVDEPLLHLLGDPDRLRLRVGHGLWVRLVDVTRALEARRYGTAGRLRIDLVDPFCPWNEGRYELEGGPDGASCRPTDAEPDLTVTASELGACYLGGVGFRQLARAGRVQERAAGALARADAMFAGDPAPWCSFVF